MGSCSYYILEIQILKYVSVFYKHSLIQELVIRLVFTDNCLDIKKWTRIRYDII
jgi:hypothetical protein